MITANGDHGGETVRINMTKEESERIRDEIADFLFWIDGYEKGSGQTTQISREALRQLQRAIKNI